MTTRDKDSSSSDSLSPAPAPLKELLREAIGLMKLLDRWPKYEAVTDFLNRAEAAIKVSALSPQPPTSELEELFKFIGVTNLKDAKQSITGLRERIKFTETFEALRDGSPHPPSEERKRDIAQEVIEEAIHGDGHCIEVSREDLYKLGDQILRRLDPPVSPLSEERLRDLVSGLITVAETETPTAFSLWVLQRAGQIQERLAPAVSPGNK